MNSNRKWAKAYQQLGLEQVKRGNQLFNLASPKSNEILLDVGCGTGDLTYQFANAVLPHGRVMAIDPDVERLEVARERTPRALKNIDWQAISVEELSVQPNYFDLIYSNYVFQFVPDQSKVLKTLYKYLKPEGRIAIQTVIGFPQIIRDVTLLMGKERGEKLLKTHHFHGDKLWETSPITEAKAWIEMLKEIGFKIHKIEDAEDFYFPSFQDFTHWWEATTSGMFSQDAIDSSKLNEYGKNYGNGVTLPKEYYLRFLAYK